MKVTISHDGCWCGDGRWDGQQIVDCPAVLPDEVYDALDAALATALQRGESEATIEAEDGRYTIRVDG